MKRNLKEEGGDKEWVSRWERRLKWEYASKETHAAGGKNG